MSRQIALGAVVGFAVAVVMLSLGSGQGSAPTSSPAPDAASAPVAAPRTPSNLLQRSRMGPLGGERGRALMVPAVEVDAGP